MSNCPGLHCPGCGKTAGGWALATAAAAVLTWLITANIVVVAAATVPVATVGGALLVRKIRRELREPVWHPGYAQVRARVNGYPALPVLTADQLAGLARLGQAVYDVQAAGQPAALRQAGYAAWNQHQEGMH